MESRLVWRLESLLDSIARPRARMPVVLNGHVLPSVQVIALKKIPQQPRKDKPIRL